MSMAIQTWPHVAGGPFSAAAAAAAALHNHSTTQLCMQCGLPQASQVCMYMMPERINQAPFCLGILSRQSCYCPGWVATYIRLVKLLQT